MSDVVLEALPQKEPRPVHVQHAPEFEIRTSSVELAPA
jgi:hypothetical protein